MILSDIGNLYIILNISSEIIYEKENNPQHLLNVIANEKSHEKKLQYISYVKKITDKFHSYFHFEQSFLYLLCGYIYHLKDEKNEVKKYLEKAIFQDHTNIQAIEFHSNPTIDFVFSYDKNYRYEKDFLSFAIGKFKKNDEIEKLDFYIKNIFNNKDIDEINYDSHRLSIVKSVFFLQNSDIEDAINEIEKAIERMENSHQNYHKFASNVHIIRSEIFKSLGEADLAKNDIVKAKDLFTNILD